MKVIVISEGRFGMEILTSFRKVFVISQGIPELLLKILKKKKLKLQKLNTFKEEVKKKLRRLSKLLLEKCFCSRKGFQNFF